MITLAFILFLTIYYYIGKYLLLIPFTILYFNYIKNTKIVYLNQYIENNKNCKGLVCKKIKNILSIDYNFSFNNFILNNRFNKNKFFILIIKFDSIFIYIFNDFLSFILFYMKYLTRFIISNQFNLGKNNNTPINIENKNKMC